MEDLLRLALSGGRPPDMGANYMSLAQAMAPMSGPGPNQAGPVGALNFGLERGNQLQMLQKAGGLAQLDAMMKAQQAGEYQAGGPGRMNAQKLRDMMIEKEFGGFDQNMKDQEQKKLLDRTKTQRQLAEEAIKRLDWAVEAWNGAENDNERGMIFKELQDRDETFGKLKFSEMEFGQTDTLMRVLGKQNENLRKDKLERDKFASQERRTKLTAEGAAERQAARIASQERIARFKALTPKQQGNIQNQLLAEARRLGGIDNLPDADKEILNYLAVKAAWPQMARAETAEPRTAIRDGKLVEDPVPVPQPPQIPLSGDKPKDKKPPPPAAVAALKANPSLAAEFDKKYGAGEAAKHLKKK